MQKPAASKIFNIYTLTLKSLCKYSYPKVSDDIYV